MQNFLSRIYFWEKLKIVFFQGKGRGGKRDPSFPVHTGALKSFV